MCAGAERPRLSDGECDLITKATTGTFVAIDPETCDAIVDPTLLGVASSGLSCSPAETMAFTPSDNATVLVYDYASVPDLDTAFNERINFYGAVQRGAENPPGWNNWILTEDPTTVKGRILGLAKNQTENNANQLRWTDIELRTQTIAQSPVVSLPGLLEAWKKAATTR